jgi:hypothetical protein
MADESVGTGAAPETAAPPATATPVAPAQSVATPQTTQPPATGGGPDGWVPSYRVRETREAAIREANTAFAQKEQQYQSQLEQVQRQLRVLVGAEPQQNPEIAAVRQQFGELYPGLAKLEQRAADLEALMERAGDIENQNSHYWTSYGRQTMDRLFTHASDSLGSPLTEEGKRALHSSFVGWVSSSPELTDRYANDPTIVEDYWKMFTSSFVDPVRRAAATTAVGRATSGAQLPQDTPGGLPRPIGGAVKPANLDERAAQAWSQYNTIAKT